MKELSNGSNMFIITAPCWSCKKEMHIALVGNESGHFDYGPEAFSENEKTVAESNGVLLKTVSSKTAEETYLANACKNCGQFIGKFYFFAHYFTPALYGEYTYEQVSLE